MNSFYSIEELDKLGLKKCGCNVLISRKASIYGAENITIGNNVRIDDFCILSGRISIRNNVHIAAGVYLFGGNTGIYLNNYVGVSSRTAIYAESDDYSGKYLTNPTLPNEYKNVICKPVFLENHVLIGTGCTILPGVRIGLGSAVGSMSLVNKDIPPFEIHAGIPAKYMKERNDNILELAKKYELKK